MMECPEGYYWNGTQCRKAISAKRKGIYGKGFLSGSRSEQEAKIRKEARIEGTARVEKQMAFLNAATSHNPSKHKDAHADLEYAKKLNLKPRSVFRDEKETGPMGKGERFPQIRTPSERCPEGYHMVLDHFRKRRGESSMALEVEGVYVSEHCARNPRKR